MKVEAFVIEQASKAEVVLPSQRTAERRPGYRAGSRAWSAWAVGSTLALVGCTASTPQAPGTPRTPRAPPPDPVVWTYAVEATGPAGSVLRIDADFAPTEARALEVDPDGAPFVRDPQYAVADGWSPLSGDGGTWVAPCRAGCRIRYGFALGDAAQRLNDAESALAAGDSIVAPPSTWLLRPTEPAGRNRFRFRVTTTGTTRFVTGIRAVAGSADAFEAATADMANATFAVFGSLRLDTIPVGAARIDVALARRGLPLTPPELLAWVARGASTLAAYYGALPVPRVLVIIVPGSGPSTRGETISEGGPAVLIRPADGLTAEVARDDWVITHELIHATLPSLGHAHAWLDEGIATYVEPIVRARAGLVTAERYWRELAQGLPQGLPEAGDRGLDRTRTWGRTYWGGALFCFVADVRIREATRGVRSFDDVLRGLIATRDDGAATVDVARFLEAADRATGTTVVSELYRTLALAPGSVDLAALWSDLGVRVVRTAITFDDQAPQASIRRAITASPTSR
jgi:hypothetical protein